MAFYSDRFPPYVRVGERAAEAARYVRQQAKAGRVLQPVLPVSHAQAATTFWGRAWCRGIEAQADFASRLDRGRSYMRHGAVVDLRLKGGNIEAEVLGSEIYQVRIKVSPVPPTKWEKLVRRCHAEVGSLVDLLQGDVSPAVMRSLTDDSRGLLPRASEMSRRCSCPDHAVLCKHMAAVLYAIGARLDREPLLLFSLRQVDARQLTAEASQATSRLAATSTTRLGDQDLGALFDIDLANTSPANTAPAKRASASARPKSSASRRASLTTAAKKASSLPSAATSVAPTKSKRGFTKKLKSTSRRGPAQ